MSSLKKIIIAFMLFTVLVTAASTTLYETEPNNTPLEANVFSGDIILTGTIEKGDQDAFMWKLSDEESQYSWNLELTGVPEGMTRIDLLKVVFSKDGKTVEDYHKYFSFGTRTGKKPVHLNELLLEKGEYLFAITSNVKNEKSYKLSIKKHIKTGSIIKKSLKKNAKRTPLNSRQVSHYMFKEPKAWFSFKIDKQDQIWALKGANTIGQKANVKVYDESDTLVAEVNSSKYGKFNINNVELGTGKHYVIYSLEQNRSKCGVQIYSTGVQVMDKDEIEPNDSQNSANIINYKKTIHGTIGDKDKYDYFTFTLPEKFDNTLFDIVLKVDNKNMQFGLYDMASQELQRKNFDSNYTMHALNLETKKSYILRVYNSNNKKIPYQLAFLNFRENDNTDDIEPNDRKQDAVNVNTGKTVFGEFSGYEYDIYRFTVEERNTFWNITLKGKNINRMTLSKAGNDIISLNSPVENMLNIKNLWLKPGEYLCHTSGKNSAYSLDIEQASFRDLNISSADEIEHEPNDGERHTNELKFNTALKGMLESKENKDYFHFTLKNDEHIRLSALPPKDGDARIKLISELLTHREYPKVGEASIMEGIYPAGRYMIDLWSKKASLNFYNLKLERLDPFTSMDKEPNDNRYMANKMTTAFHVKGYTSSDDNDFYAFLENMTKETNVTISGNNLYGNIEIFPNKIDKDIDLIWNDENKTYTFTLKTPNTAYLKVESYTGNYDYNLSYTVYAQSEAVPLDVEVSVENNNSTIAAYSDMGQKTEAILLLKNKSDKAVKLTIDAHTSDSKWRVVYDKNVSLSASEIKSVKVVLFAPKNVSNESMVTTFKVENSEGVFKTTSFKVEADTSAQIVEPYEDWVVPKKMLGGFNVARLDYGGKRVLEYEESEEGRVPDIGRGYHYLFDGEVYENVLYLYDDRKTVDDNVTIELAGKKPCMVTGVMLNPMTDNNKEYQLKDFTVSLSEDGVTYTKVLSASLSYEEEDQYFVFDKPYLAKYAKLTLHNNQRNKAIDRIYLGEWKVIAQQKSVSIDNSYNIANPKLGGHVVSSTKVFSTYWDREILTAKDDMRSSSRFYSKDNNVHWVVGFKNERVAKIESMKWKEPNDVKKETYIKEVKIWVSTQTPVGPWIQMPKWIKSENNESTYLFEKPTWARYVKFEIPAVKESTYLSLPEELQVFEAQPGSEYRSILGEWGSKNHKSYYEFLAQAKSEPLEVIQGNESKETAYALDMNKTIKGRVSVANHEEDWYKIVIPQGENLLTLSLFDKQSVEVSYELTDSNGTLLKPKDKRIEPVKHLYSFDVNEGEYRLKVKQPPISVVFTWDNSGSVSPYHAQIFDAVNNYVGKIEENIDAVNLLCFNKKNRMMLADFSSNATVVETVYNNFDWRCSDSDIERPLRVSSEALKQREGTKGVIIIGDAVGSRDMKVWESLKEVKPKVFSIRVLSQTHDNALYEGLMQSWSRVNNGTYNVVSNGVELYKAIDQASAILRRPVYYNLNVESKYVRPLDDGSLQILKPKKAKVNKSLAIELILDASGSMLKRIDGKRRISIAKEVLKKAVKDIIPVKTQVALRVFGHKKADSCRTDLEMKLQPLNVKKTTKIIAKINAKNLAKTPIAASLAKVADDLKKAKGKKVIILVTDGEETCEGDPAKEIQNLKDKGFDVRVNIVGFAIDDESLKAQFKEWATIGNGGYFEANDKKSLNEAVKKALQIPYKVYNKNDELVVNGIVGAPPVKLKGGIYRVIVESSPQRILEEVMVIGEEEKVIELKDEK